jgi:hypothetical protein
MTMMVLLFFLVLIGIPVLAYKGVGFGRGLYGALCAVAGTVILLQIGSAFTETGPQSQGLAAVNSFLSNGGVAVFIGSLIGLCLFRKRPAPR